MSLSCEPVSSVTLDRFTTLLPTNLNRPTIVGLKIAWRKQKHFKENKQKPLMDQHKRELPSITALAHCDGSFDPLKDTDHMVRRSCERSNF